MSTLIEALLGIGFFIFFIFLSRVGRIEKDQKVFLSRIFSNICKSLNLGFYAENSDAIMSFNYFLIAISIVVQIFFVILG